MRLIWVLVKKDLLEIYRTKKLLIAAFILLFAALSSPAIAKLMPELLKNLGTPGLTFNLPEPTYKDAIDQFVKNISQLVLFILIFVVCGAVADEKSRRNLELLIAKPVSRSSYIIAKFIAYLGAIKLLYIGASIIFGVYTFSLFGVFPTLNFIIAAILVLLYLALILAITLLVSTASRNAFWAAGAGIFGLFIFNIIFAIFSKFEKFNPSYILGEYNRIIQGGWNSDFLPSIIVSLALILICLILAIFSFQKQEIE